MWLEGGAVSTVIVADSLCEREIFGPVASIIKFRDEAEALRIANGTAYSLAAGVWSRDIGRVQRFAKKANAGTVWINTYGYTDVRLPWGGVRDSGFGREHGTAAIDNFTEPKAVWMNLTSEGSASQAYQPNVKAYAWTPGSRKRISKV